MKKLNYFILPVFFFGFIYYMFLNQIFGWIVFKSDAENRALATFPVPNINNLQNYPEEYDAYLNDNYTFRALFLDTYHEYKFQLNISPNPENVLIGSNGHFFLANPDQKIFEGKQDFDLKALTKFEKIWKQKRAYLSEKNIPFYWLIAPNKHHVYTDELPMGIYEKTKNRSLVLTEYLEKTFPNIVVYPLQTLIDHKDNAYFKQDTHWSEKGAFYSYLDLMKRMKQENPSLKSLNEKQVRWKVIQRSSGNLLNYLGKEGELSEKVYKAQIQHASAKPASPFDLKNPKEFRNTWDYQYHFTNQKALNKQRVLIVRDSYGESIIPFFNETFSETLYIFDAWKYSINKEVIALYKPDLIIFLTLETNLESIITKEQIIEHE